MLGNLNKFAFWYVSIFFNVIFVILFHYNLFLSIFAINIWNFWKFNDICNIWGSCLDFWIFAEPRTKPIVQRNMKYLSKPIWRYWSRLKAEKFKYTYMRKTCVSSRQNKSNGHLLFSRSRRIGTYTQAVLHTLSHTLTHTQTHTQCVYNVTYLDTHTAREQFHVEQKK